MYKGHRFPPEIIQYAVWLYHRFSLSHRDIEDLLAERGITVTYESIRLWCIKFGLKYVRRLKKHRGYGDTFFIDEVFVKIDGKPYYLWRAVDQDGEIVDVFLQRRRDGAAAKRFLKRLLHTNGNEPRRIATDKLRSYGVAHRELIPDTVHDTARYANNRAELSHQPTRVRERGMRKFKSLSQAQRFLSNHAAVYNLFNLGRHLISAEHYRTFRGRSLPLGYNAPLRLGNVPQPSSSRIRRKPFEAESHFVSTIFTARVLGLIQNPAERSQRFLAMGCSEFFARALKKNVFWNVGRLWAPSAEGKTVVFTNGKQPANLRELCTT